MSHRLLPRGTRLGLGSDAITGDTTASRTCQDYRSWRSTPPPAEVGLSLESLLTKNRTHLEQSDEARTATPRPSKRWQRRTPDRAVPTPAVLRWRNHTEHYEAGAIGEHLLPCSAESALALGRSSRALPHTPGALEAQGARGARPASRSVTDAVYEVLFTVEGRRLRCCRSSSFVIRCACPLFTSRPWAVSQSTTVGVCVLSSTFIA